MIETRFEMPVAVVMVWRGIFLNHLAPRCAALLPLGTCYLIIAVYNRIAIADVRI